MTRLLRLFALAVCVVVGLGCRTSIQSPSAPEPMSSSVPELGEPPPANDDDPNGLFAYTAPGELPRIVVVADGEVEQTLPLKHTDVDARVRGHVAEVLVTQSFHNDRSEAIEVTYTFPLPENSAVDDMRIVIGERVIHSEVQTRAQARRTYDEARSAGHTAALLEQERPNIFTQSIANVAPGETIEVELSYLQTLTADAGTYEFVFPMVVGPRFIPGATSETPGERSGTGGSPDTDAVPDASRITPPVLGEGRRSGHDLSLSLDVQTGASVSSWDAPTHTVVGTATAQGFAVRLADAETIPNRDFVLRWNAADDKPRASLFLGPANEAGRGHFTLLIQPPRLDLDALVGRREMIFVVDRSGSMSGVPLALAKLTLREALRRLRPVDTFDVVGFESGTVRLFGDPRPANEHNLVLAERFIDGMQAGGGTMMAGAVEAALAPRIAPGRHRYVFFLTDGFIGNESEIFAGAAQLVRRAEQAGARSRVFGLGIGSAPNRYLIDELSESGDGAALYVSNREQPRAAVESYYRYVDHPVLEDLELDWGGLQVEELYPGELPELFASHAVIVHGRYAGQVERDLQLRATIAGSSEQVELPVVIAPSPADARTSSTLWAREKIAELTAASWDGELAHDEAARAITQLGLEHHLVTAYTSFVAVDDSRVIGSGNPNLVVQPVEVPEDVDASMAGAYVLDGTSVSNDGFSGVMEITVESPKASSAPATMAAVQYGSELRTTDGSSSGSRKRRAWLSIGELSVDEGGRARDLKRSLRQRAPMFEACYEQRVGRKGKASLRWRLHFDGRGKLVRVDLRSGTLGSAYADECIEAVLLVVDWRGLPDAATVIEVELGLRMR